MSSSSSADLAIEVANLKKSYGNLSVLKGISFSVERGEIFAILGPNGAGKTTCIEILEGYRMADSGEVSVLGFDPKDQSLDFRQKIGIVVQTSGLENELTVREALKLYSSPYENPRNADELLELVQLTHKADVRVEKLSGGQRRRLDLALGLVGDPDLIFLDEPTTGFSPEARRNSWDMLENLCQLGKTILLTSHYMEEVERLADRMAILLDGKIVKEGATSDLRQGLTSVSFTLPNSWVGSLSNSLGSSLDNSSGDENSNVENENSSLGQMPSLLLGFEKRPEVERVDIDGDDIYFLTDSPVLLLREITSMSGADEIANLLVRQVELEDIYLDAISGNQDDGEEATDNADD